MAKVINPCFLQEAGAYLEANGYERSDGAFLSHTIFFSKEGRGVVISHDNADFVTYNDPIPGNTLPPFNRYMALTGISSLDLFKWKLVFHITDMVIMDRFNTAEIPNNPSVDLLTDVFAHFGQVGKKPIPVAY